jgi:hypothetical protein
MIFSLARNLIDLVDIDDATLRPFDIVVSRLQQPQDDVLDILTDVTGFGQRRRVGHGERHVDDPRQSLRQQRLAAPGRADQQNVRFGDLDFVRLVGGVEPLVMIVDGDGEHPLGMVLANHVVVQDRANLFRCRNAIARLDQRGLVLFADDVHAQLDAFVADEHGRARDQLADLVLALAAKRAVECVLRITAAGFCHNHSIASRSIPTVC